MISSFHNDHHGIWTDGVNLSHDVITTEAVVGLPEIKSGIVYVDALYNLSAIIIIFDIFHCI